MQPRKIFLANDAVYEIPLGRHALSSCAFSGASGTMFMAPSESKALILKIILSALESIFSTDLPFAG